MKTGLGVPSLVSLANFLGKMILKSHAHFLSRSVCLLVLFHLVLASFGSMDVSLYVFGGSSP